MTRATVRISDVSAGAGGSAAAGSGGAAGADSSVPAAPWQQSVTVRVRFDCRGMPLVPYEIELVLDTSNPPGDTTIAVRPAGADGMGSRN